MPIEKSFKRSLCKIVQEGGVSVGVDLKFTIKRGDSYGMSGRPNPLSNFFIHKYEEANLCDAQSIKLTPSQGMVIWEMMVYPRGLTYSLFLMDFWQR
jgi:hypothetical protein